jgi:hypothetical protein
MRRHLALVGVVAVGLAACGGGGSKSVVAPPTTAPPTTVSTAADEAAVATVWTAFFNAATPPAQALTLLQNGAVLAPEITKLRKLMPAGLTAKVSAVAVTGTDALVTYQLIANGQSLLGATASTGHAIEVNGTWLVSQPTFCALSTLAGAPCPS